MKVKSVTKKSDALFRTKEIPSGGAMEMTSTDHDVERSKESARMNSATCIKVET